MAKEAKLTEFMDFLFDEFNKDMRAAEAEIRVFEGLTKKNYKQMLENRSLERLSALMVAILDTSSSTWNHLEAMDKACLEGMAQASRKASRLKIQDAKGVIKKARLTVVASFNRLPFSMGKGWKPKGEISTIRHLINIPGYALIIPWMFVGKKLGKHDPNYQYDLGVAKLHELLKELKDDKTHYTKQREIKSQLREAYDMLRDLMRAYRRGYSRFRRARKKVTDLLNEAGNVKIDTERAMPEWMVERTQMSGRYPGWFGEKKKKGGWA